MVGTWSRLVEVVFGPLGNRDRLRTIKYVVVIHIIKE